MHFSRGHRSCHSVSVSIQVQIASRLRRHLGYNCMHKYDGYAHTRVCLCVVTMSYYRRVTLVVGPKVLYTCGPGVGTGTLCVRGSSPRVCGQQKFERRLVRLRATSGYWHHTCVPDPIPTRVVTNFRASITSHVRPDVGVRTRRQLDPWVACRVQSRPRVLLRLGTSCKWCKEVLSCVKVPRVESDTVLGNISRSFGTQRLTFSDSVSNV